MDIYTRRPTRAVWVGNVQVGDNAPVRVQSMTNTDTRDVTATVSQIHQLEEVGCELVRVAVPDREAALALGAIRQQIGIPLIADIHFDYRLALEAVTQGVDGLRINPGNIGDRERVRQVAEAARAAGIAIRVGVNSGSLERDLLQQYGSPTAAALAESALRNLAVLADLGLTQLKLSLKSSHVPTMVAAYRLVSAAVDFPLHLGVTEAGTKMTGAVKSAVGLGILLAEGIGDTLRVSLTAPPPEEVKVGYTVLQALGLRERGVEIISCPTCGRCQIGLEAIAQEVEQRLQHVAKPLKVAVMGCPVNGPGEARQADVGIAGGKGQGLVFRQGLVVRKVPEDQLVEALMQEVNQMLEGEEL